MELTHTHLRSSDFFDVETHPTLTFELTGVKYAAASDLLVSGVLRIRDGALAIETPVAATTDGSGHLTLAPRCNR